MKEGVPISLSTNTARLFVARAPGPRDRTASERPRPTFLRREPPRLTRLGRLTPKASIDALFRPIVPSHVIGGFVMAICEWCGSATQADALFSARRLVASRSKLAARKICLAWVASRMKRYPLLSLPRHPLPVHPIGRVAAMHLPGLSSNRIGPAVCGFCFSAGYRSSVGCRH